MVNDKWLMINGLLEVVVCFLGGAKITYFVINFQLFLQRFFLT
jgi:hypothetical protein